MRTQSIQFRNPLYEPHPDIPKVGESTEEDMSNKDRDALSNLQEGHHILSKGGVVKDCPRISTTALNCKVSK